MRRHVRLVVVAGGAVLGGLSVGAPNAAVASTCTDASGVTVVVDARAIGGSLSVRCAASAAGRTGLDALKAAGYSVAGTARYGESFICRIAGAPSSSQRLPVRGNEGYRESCVNTPPAAASWSYWYADNGGSWTYSQAGVKNRTVVAGGFEGWRFQLNQGPGSLSPPGVTPTRAAPAAADPSAAPSAVSESGGSAGPEESASPSPYAGASPSPAGASPSSGGSSALPAPRPPSSAATQDAAPTRAPQRTEAAAATSNDSDPAAAGRVTPWVGAAALAGLLGAAGLAAQRRRRRGGGT